MTFPNLGNLGIGRGDDDDLFAHTRMSFGDHIEELRTRMIRAILGFLAALVIGLFLGQPVLEFIQKPVQDQLNAFYDERVAREKKKLDEETEAAKKQAAETGQDYVAGPEFDQQEFDPNTQSWITKRVRIPLNRFTIEQQKYQRLFNRPSSLTTLTVTEAFMTYFMVSIYCGIILASPWIFWQLWQFISAGLYPHEKKYVYMYLPLSLALFLGGCALAQFVVLPLGIHYLLSFNDWLGVEPELRLSEWLSFAVMVPLIFGAAFQTPLVMLFLERMGIVDITLYTKNRKMAYFILAIIGAVLAAAPDALNMMMLTVPLWSLYEFGILLARFAPRQKQELEEPDPEEMVEV